MLWRDVTATVPSIPLITGSIMSKKLAESLNALVLDVKFGSGAFMKTFEQATALAESLVRTGERMGVRTVALLTDMNQPLGRMCGNAVEVIESMDVLKGDGPADVRDLTIELCSELLVMTHRASTVEQARVQCAAIIDSGRAPERYCRMVVAQGGNPHATLPVAPATDITAPHSGWVREMDTESRLDWPLSVLAAAGRRWAIQSITASALEMLVRIGDRVEQGQPLVRVFSKDAAHVKSMILSSITIGDHVAHCR
ncbi:MAG: hypothetical protein U0996_24010 [Planctomycetaceae bacterium]